MSRLKHVTPATHARGALATPSARILVLFLPLSNPLKKDTRPPLLHDLHSVHSRHPPLDSDRSPLGND